MVSWAHLTDAACDGLDGVDVEGVHSGGSTIRYSCHTLFIMNARKTQERIVVRLGRDIQLVAMDVVVVLVEVGSRVVYR